MSEKDGNKVYRVTKYTIDKDHKLFDYCDEETFKAKNLKNLGNYCIRQCFILHSKKENELTKPQKEFLDEINNAINHFNIEKKANFDNKKPEKVKKAELDLQKFMQDHKNDKDYQEELEKKQQALEKLRNSEYKPQQNINNKNGLFSYDFLDYYFSKCLKTEDNPYKMLAVQTSQQILRNLFKDWKSFFKSNKDYKKNPDKYTGRPKLPKYKEKDGRVKLSMTNQSCKVDGRKLILPKTRLTLTIGVDTEGLKLKEVRIVPMGSVYKMEAVWEKEKTTVNNLRDDAFIGIDLGLSNLATITNNIGLRPIIINGKPIKSINQFYNKKRAIIQKNLGFYEYEYKDKDGVTYTQKRQIKTSKKLDKITLKRNARIDDYMHQSSALIVKYCLENRIGNIVIGKNQGWKNGINIGRRNNQNFVSVPHNKLIGMIQYKAEEKGIKVHIVEESYTSKASFLDLDNLPTYKKGKKHKFSGRRDKRGLYKTGKIIINADVNGSYNIIRKFDNTIFNEKNVKDVLTIPTVITPNNNKKKLKEKHKKSQEEQNAQNEDKKCLK